MEWNWILFFKFTINLKFNNVKIIILYLIKNYISLVDNDVDKSKRTCRIKHVCGWVKSAHKQKKNSNL